MCLCLYCGQEVRFDTDGLVRFLISLQLVGASGLITTRQTDLQTLCDSLYSASGTGRKCHTVPVPKSESILSPHDRKPDNI